MQNLSNELDRIVNRLNEFKDEIEQLQEDNNTLNDNIRLLEAERDDGYKSFNTETHILISIEDLVSFKNEIEDARSSAGGAQEDAETAKGYADEAGCSAGYAEEYCNNAENKISKIIDNAKKGKGEQNDK